jgi:molybdate transport system substrate-binding protein
MEIKTTRREVLVALLLAACGSRPAGAGQTGQALRVAAAADLTRAFTEVAAAYQKRFGQEIKPIFGASGQLAQQIENGAPYDVFASANEEYVASLDRGGLLLPGSRQVYAIGHLVLWTRENGPPCPRRIEDLADSRYIHIAIANPDHAPYGIAAREALQSAKIWDAIKPRLVYGENIQATQQFAATGNADVALLSLSLALGSKGHYQPVPAKLYKPLRQAIGILKSSTQPDNARRFVAFVRTSEGAAILRRYGFVIPR